MATMFRNSFSNSTRLSIIITPPWNTADMKYVKKLLYDRERPWSIRAIGYDGLSFLTVFY
jgi:hypothetical protein